MSYQPFENEPETIQSTTNLDDVYPEMDPEAQNNAGSSNNSVNRNYQSSKGDVLVTCCGRPFHSRSIAVLFIFFNLVVHIMNYGRSWRNSIENNNSHGHNYDPSLNEETSSAANIEDGLIMLNHCQVWLEAFLSVFALYGIVKNSARHVHWYILWCCFEAAVEILVILFFVYLTSKTDITLQLIFNFIFLFMLCIPLFSLAEIYVLLVHYRFLRSAYPQNSASFRFDLQQMYYKIRQ